MYTVLFAFFAYHYVFAGQLDERFVQLSGSSDYLSYAILGGAFYAFAVSTLMNVSRSLITELREGTLEALLLTPSPRRGYFLGNVCQQIMRTVFEFSVILVVGAVFGLTLANTNIWSAVLVWVLSTVAFFCQALVLGSLMLLLAICLALSLFPQTHPLPIPLLYPSRPFTYIGSRNHCI